jgi:uncharacterized membrane protein YfcA
VAGARACPHVDAGDPRAVRRRPGPVLRGPAAERGRRRIHRRGFGQRRGQPGERLVVVLGSRDFVLPGPVLGGVVDVPQLAGNRAQLVAVPGAGEQLVRSRKLRGAVVVRARDLGRKLHPGAFGSPDQLTGWQSLLLVPAGAAAGLIGSVAGLASLVSYPALLAVGLGPVCANVTNTVAVVFSSVGSVSASGPELHGQRRSVLRVASVGVLGGLAGGLLLLATPSDAFARLVPWLIGLGSLAIALPRRTADARRHAHPAVVLPAVLAISLYGGYFGAAAGVLMLALFLRVTHEPLPRANALKNVVLGAANLVAAVLFAVVADVDWVAVVPLAAGFLIGGRLGPVVVRRAPAGVLRPVIASVGLGLAVYLAIKAYR